MIRSHDRADPRRGAGRGRRILLAAFLVAVFGAPATAGAAPAGGATPGGSEPYHDLRSTPLENHAPAGEEPALEGLTEVRLGWFGPSDPADPAGGDFWSGARLAVDEINREGGVAGRPVRLVPGWSESPWTGGVNRVVRMVYEDRVWAIVGSIDGAATHLAEQVAAKALVPLVSPGSTDKTVSFAGVPWMFTLLPGDDVQAAAAAAWIARRPEARSVTLVSATDHDSRAAAAEWRAVFAREGIPVAADFACAADGSDADSIAGHVLGATAGAGLRTAGADALPDHRRGDAPGARPGAGSVPRAVILLASPAASGRIAAALRPAGYRGTILGGANLARRGFLEAAGPAAQGAIFPLLHDPESERWKRFSGSYSARFSHHPDFAAGAGYDALRLTVEAARRAGLSRAGIREALAGTPPGSGVLGGIRFDGLGRNQVSVRLATLRDGRIRPLEAR